MRIDILQHVHDEMAQPVEVTSKTTRTEGEDAQWKMSASRPFEPTTQTQHTTEQRVVEDESRYRDSFIAASEGEGFWTDGAYTTSPSPPPIPRHRVLEEELREKKITDIGLSRTSSEPQFIRGFHREYTVDEGSSISIECVLVGNPRPKVRFFINDKEIRKESKFVEIVTSGDTYSIVIDKARLEHAGYYKIVAENTRGKTESLTMLHVRPQSLIQHHKRNGHALPSQKITEYRTPTEHTTVTEEFAMFEYEQRRPQKHETSRLVTPPPAKRFQAHRKDEEMLEHYDLEQRQSAGHPPHFTQTLVAAVAADGETAKFEGIVTGWPAPTVEWTKDGEPFTRTTLPDVDISNIGGRVSLSFKNCSTIHGGKYMCTARNASGVATSSAQLVIRPKTVAPDFIQRLISEEMVEGDQLKWTVRVTGDPLPRVTWLRDGIEIPDCEEVRIIDEGNGVHSLLIVRVEIADSGQFTCLAENVAGEARSTADLVVRQPGSRPGSYFHITKVTQEKQVRCKGNIQYATVPSPSRTHRYRVRCYEQRMLCETLPRSR
ncbi:immunoglobulin I-set domain protein [Ancylostoma caninum]|uniref:Immunoglobulin I-set domain protein n=1 Tax=Ancylostoma caninum TaxID=29170 RepID=A0A368FSM3_ANCCA|nr:immunoglobulin I-set domain protein [Ancylostoma caninum]